MKTKQNLQIILIILLLVIIIGMSIGFSAFSRQLNISSGASVTPSDDQFIVRLSSSNSSYSRNGVVPVLSPTNLQASNATISSNALSISDLNVYFTEPGQSATYTMYVQNAGKYIAYLSNVNFNKTNNEFKTCTSTSVLEALSATESTLPIFLNNTVQKLESMPDNNIYTTPGSPELVEQACDGIKYTVTVNGESFTESALSTDKTGIPISSFKPVIIKIEYLSNATRVDGAFKVKFGTVSFSFSTVAN